MAHVVRHGVVKAPVTKSAEIERLWKQECAPLMIKQPGCVREELLRGLDDPERFVSVAEWSGQDAINRYLASPAHEEIKQLTRAITGAAATVHPFAVVEG